MAAAMAESEEEQRPEQQQQHPLALPQGFSPDDLDAISELCTVLAKLRASMQSAGLATSSSGSGIAPAGPNTQGQQLSVKEIPGATDALKHKLQHAREQVRSLPNMARSIEEQELEMERLRARIRQQRALLARLCDDGLLLTKAEASVEDVKMEM